MKLRADEMDELAFLCRDVCHGAREQLRAESDDKATASMGRLWRATRMIAAGVASLAWAVAVFVVLAACCGCHRTDASDRYAAMVSAYERSETADLQENDTSFSDKNCDTPQVRARERDQRFVEFPTTCVLKFTGQHCGPCKTETISSWLRASGWKVEPVPVESRADLFDTCDVQAIPTFIVLRGGNEVARYTGVSRVEFLPLLKAACQ